MQEDLHLNSLVWGDSRIVRAHAVPPRCGAFQIEAYVPVVRVRHIQRLRRLRIEGDCPTTATPTELSRRQRHSGACARVCGTRRGREGREELAISVCPGGRGAPGKLKLDGSTVSVGGPNAGGIAMTVD